MPAAGVVYNDDGPTRLAKRLRQEQNINLNSRLEGTSDLNPPLFGQLRSGKAGDIFSE